MLRWGSRLLRRLASSPAGVDAGAAGLLPLCAAGPTVAPAAAVAAAAAAVPAPSRGYAKHIDVAPEQHPHHHYADSHRPGEAPTYRVGADGRVEAVQRAAAPPRQHFAAAQQQRAARPPGPPPDELVTLAEEFEVPDRSAFIKAVARLQVERQHALLVNASSVASYLKGLGLPAAQVAAMLQVCPALFSHPAEERAEVLMGELMGDSIGKSAAQAAELFIRCPALANTRHLMPSIVRVVADHHGDD